MNKKILILLGLVWSISDFSQTNTDLTDSYQPPQTIVNQTVRMLPGFHADSRNTVYNNGAFFYAKTGSSTQSTQPPVVYNPSGVENYIYTRTYLAPVTSSNQYAPQVQSITYFDGLGRPKQNIAIRSTPSGEDLVADTPYDPFGRQVDSWMVAPMPTSNGTIQTGSQSAATGFYGDTVPYSHTILEDSPLNRVMGQKVPGSAWQSNPITYTYDTNINDGIKNFVTTTTWTDNIATTTFTANTLCTNNELFKNKIKDEDGSEVISFTNKKGQTVLERRYTAANGNIDTYYIYNEYDQMSYIIPPLAVEEIDGGKLLNDVLKNLCYQYKYDYKNRLIEKKLPGKEWEYIVYNKYDMLVLYQDINLKIGNSGTSADSWVFTKYDQLGRTAYTGITTDTRSRKDIQSFLDTQTVTSETRSSGTGMTVSGLSIHFTNSSYPTTISSLLSVNYYDTYPTLSPPPSIPGTIRDQKVLGNAYAGSEYNADAKISTKGLPTASFVRNIEDNYWTKSYMFYDLQARPIATYTTNHLGGYTNAESILDFTGKVLESYTSHKRNAAATEVKIKERFEYSPQQYLVKHYHQVDSQPEELLTENKYDRIGRLENKKVGNSLQQIDYKYNVRGWLKEINDITNIGNDLFAYKIHYQDPEQTQDNPDTGYKKYNGNITEVQWKYSNNDILKKYYYKYDELDRLRESKYRIVDTGVITPDQYNESMSYDRNGNIAHLDRFAPAGKFNYPGQIDDLTYIYKDPANNATNQLFKITDASNNISGYKSLGGTNQYDQNGNMTIMPDKGISNPIKYNFLGLPQTINNGNITENLYRADGSKLQKKHIFTTASQFIITEYLDGFQYVSPRTTTIRTALESDDPLVVQSVKATQPEVFESEEQEEAALPEGTGTMALQFFPTSEGFYDYVHKMYIYQYKDQVGNNRLSFYKDKTSGSLEAKDYNDYYPLGLNHKVSTGTIYDPIAVPYNYKFQEQELQETGFYAFKWRNYDPSMGRFFNADPLSEKYAYQSHYNFSENRVINSREIEGLEAKDNYEGAKFDGKDYDGGIDYVKELPNQEREAGITEVKMQPLSTPDFDLGNFVENQVFGIYTDESWNNVGNASARYWESVANSLNATAVDNFEKYLWGGSMGVIAAPAFPYIFALSGEMGAGAIGGRMLTDATVQTAANYSTNGGNLGTAVGNINFTQTVLAGAGVHYIGNSIISASTNLSIQSQNSIFNGTRSGADFVKQTSLGVMGGAVVGGVSGSSVFKSTVVGAYMRTTSSFGQTAGTTVANVLMSTPDYGASVIQNKIP